MQPQEQQPTREQFIKSLFLTEHKDNIHEGRERLVKGIEKGVDAIKHSYGSAGFNVIVEEEVYPFHRLTNDGRAILKDIKLSDGVENIGLSMLKEVGDKSDRDSGDGRKSSILITHAIIKEGLKSDASPMNIKKSIDDALPIVLKELEKLTKEITPKDVGAIATIASESEYIGSLFQEIYEKIGKDGIVELDNSGLSETFYETTEGVRLMGCGFLWPYMANEDKGRKAVFTYPKILITRQKIAKIGDIDGVIKRLTEEGRDELVIFCDEIDLSVSQALAYIQMEGVKQKDGSLLKFKTLVIKAPTLWKDWIYEDFSKITGATIIDPAQGVSLGNMGLRHLGNCDKIITSKEETIVLPNVDFSQHIEVLKEDNSDEAKIRLSRLQTKTAILKLGANSESELSHLRGKALDARNSSYLALNYGIVPGGGIALYLASRKLKDTLGGKILKKALEYPVNQICENLGLKIGKDMVLGVDTFGEGVQDASTVVKNSLINAVSVAGIVLTSKIIITKSK